MPEILENINESLTHLQKQISVINDNIKGLKEEVGDLRNEVGDLRSEMNERFNYHETWLRSIEKNMATKGQVNSLLGILSRKNVISSYEASHVTQSA